MAQLVRVQSVEAKCMRSRVEHATAEVTHPQRASPGRREHQVIPALASNVLRECIGKEPRSRLSVGPSAVNDRARPAPLFECAWRPSGGFPRAVLAQRAAVLRMGLRVRCATFGPSGRGVVRPWRNHRGRSIVRRGLLGAW